MAGLAGASTDYGSEEALIQPHIFKAEQRPQFLAHLITGLFLFAVELLGFVNDTFICVGLGQEESGGLVAERVLRV